MTIVEIVGLMSENDKNLLLNMLNYFAKINVCITKNEKVDTVTLGVKLKVYMDLCKKYSLPLVSNIDFEKSPELIQPFILSQLSMFYN